MNSRHYDNDQLVELREQAGLTKVQLAAKLGISLMTVYRVEGGKICSVDLLHQWAGFFRVPASSLLYARIKPLKKISRRA